MIAHTAEILRSKDAAAVEAELTRFTLINTIGSDRRTLDLLQLHGAKTLADTIMRGSDRPITGHDIRGMHRMIMGSHHSAGRYKMWCNQISGAEHIPFAPSDTPSAMGELTDWFAGIRQEQLLPPVVAAATVHAWLAHIHPFEDGNGRVARLLANIIVGGAGLPSVIIRVSGDRSRYIHALAISDQEGDLAPLTGVFLRVLKHSIKDMRDPAWALKIFEDEIRKRASSSYTQWKTSFLSWLDLLGGRLALHGLSIRTDPEEMIDAVGFARIKAREREGLVVGGIGEPQRYPNSRAYLLLNPAEALFLRTYCTR
ncbi:Fic family protein [Spirillospora sp. CA-253888]